MLASVVAKERTPHLVFTALCIIWGSTWLGIKIGLAFLPPFIFAGLRFAAATLILIPFVGLMHSRIPRVRGAWSLMLFLGVFQLTIPYGLVFWGEQYISSGLAAVLFAALPLFVSLFAHFGIDEKLTRTKAAGILSSFIGLIAIFWQDISMQNIATSTAFLGGMAVVASSASAGIANVVAKKHAERIDPAFSVLIQSAVCTVALSALGFFLEGSMPLHFTIVAVGAVLYLGIVGSALAFVGLYWLFTKTKVTNASLLAFVTPILALLFGWLALGEVPSQNVSLGTLLILAGVYMTLKPTGRLL